MSTLVKEVGYCANRAQGENPYGFSFEPWYSYCVHVKCQGVIPYSPSFAQRRGLRKTSFVVLKTERPSQYLALNTTACVFEIETFAE